MNKNSEKDIQSFKKIKENIKRYFIEEEFGSFDDTQLDSIGLSESRLSVAHTTKGENDELELNTFVNFQEKSVVRELSGDQVFITKTCAYESYEDMAINSDYWDWEFFTELNIDYDLLIERAAYKQCFKEAEALCRDGFSPAIDDLQEEKIGHILFKVLNEHDVISEGHVEIENANVLKEAEQFMAKWVNYIEPEFDHEKKMYQSYNQSMKNLNEIEM